MTTYATNIVTPANAIVTALATANQEFGTIAALLGSIGTLD